MIINSLQNTLIKNLLKLYKPSERKLKNQMIIEGFREVKRALESNWEIIEIYYCPDLCSEKIEKIIFDYKSNKNISIITCSKNVYRKISYRKNPDGILAVSFIKKVKLEHLNIINNELFIIAESIEKPGNLGSLLRIAESADIKTIILLNSKTDISNPNVVRSSIGSLFNISIVETEINKLTPWLSKNKIQSVAAITNSNNNYTDINFIKSTAIFLGSEDKGLSNNIINHVDYCATIPMLGNNDSLNVSSAAAILVYEAIRQRNL